MKEIQYQSQIDIASNEGVSANDCFNALTADQKTMVENSTTILSFTKGETIIKQGYVATHALLIESGLVKLDVTNDKKTSTIRLLGNKSFVGIACSFACKTLDFSAIALEDTVISMINLSVFEILIKENGEFALKLIRHMSQGTNSIVHWTTKLANKNVEGSLAMVIREFSRVYSSNKFSLPVTRIGLAELAGCSKESAIHALTHFHNDGIIELDGKDIRIIDEDKLDFLIKIG